MADSTCEVEYITASDAAKEAVWLWKFINELRVAPSLDGPILLYCDSIGAIAQAKEPKSDQWAKHILHPPDPEDRGSKWCQVSKDRWKEESDWPIY